MDKAESIKYCIDGVKYFLKIDNSCKNIDEQLDVLKRYCFKNLKGNDFGKSSTNNFDADDTLLARMVYFLVWYEGAEKVNGIDYSLFGLNTFEDIGYRKIYRGDTINNFSHIYGNDDIILTKFDLNAFKNEVFIENCYTIGNFMLLPGKTDGCSLNNLKNSCCKDYADLFFKRLYPDGHIINKSDNTAIFHSVVNVNKNILPKDYKNFCEKNILNVFCDERFKPKIIYLHYNKSSFYNFSNMKNSDENRAIYKSFIEQYVKVATSVINFRAERICAILKDRLKS